MRHYTQLIHLRAIIKDMEKNEGLHTLSQTERDILFAATDVAGKAIKIVRMGLNVIIMIYDRT